MAFYVVGDESELKRIAEGKFRQGDVNVLLKRAAQLQWLLLPEEQRTEDELRRVMHDSLTESCSTFLEEWKKQFPEQEQETKPQAD